MLWWKCLIPTGHVGAGKSDSTIAFVQAPNAIKAYDIACRLPGAKKGKTAPGPDVEPWSGLPPHGAWKWYWKR